MVVREQLISTLAGARDRVGADLGLGNAPLPAVRLSVPPGSEAGDFSSDLALELSRQARQPAPELARALAAQLQGAPDLVERVEISPSGLLNFHLRSGWIEDAVREVVALGADYGRRAAGEDAPSVQVEFVSADPTGPLTITHGRGAVLGDALANLLEWTGHRVTRESYVNDAGRQRERFGRALESAYLRGGEGSTPGEGFAAEIAARIRAEQGAALASLSGDERLRALAAAGFQQVLRQQRAVLASLGVRIDEWRSEEAVLAEGKLDQAVAALRQRDLIYEAEGALWLRSTSQQETEDRPLVRSNGQPTYLAGDLAYHLDKFSRGFSRVIDIWGPHHAAYVERTLAGVGALGCDPGALEIVVFQPVSLKIEGVVLHGGEGGAHSGNNLLLDQVIEKAGRETLRFLYLSRPAGSPLELDLDALAGADNPAYPVLWAYAEAGAAVTRAEDSPAGSTPADVDLGALTDPRERALMRRLADFPDEVTIAAQEREPARLTRYALELAAAFEAFRAVDEAGPISAAHALICRATRGVLGNTLAILGISPES